MAVEIQRFGGLPGPGTAGHHGLDLSGLRGTVRATMAVGIDPKV